MFVSKEVPNCSLFEELIVILERDQSFSETIEEIERIQAEETDIFEKGGTQSGSQTGEEYRQELREALNMNLGQDITDLPWKVGSGMIKGDRSGYFFCGKIGEGFLLTIEKKSFIFIHEYLEKN